MLSHIHPLDRENFLALLKQANQPSESSSCELRFIRPDGSQRWSLTSGWVIQDSTGQPTQFAGVDLDITARKHIEERQLLLVRELDHRAKNLLAIVQSVLHLSRASTIDELVTAVDGRIAALSQAHSLLSESRWQGVDLSRLVDQEIAPFSIHGSEQINARGPKVLLDPSAAQSMALALHELVTNAVKHGALSVSHGQVDLTWQFEDDELRIVWIESGGPSVHQPLQSGFGTKVITSSLQHQLRGNYYPEWRSEGFKCTLSIPRAQLHGVSNGDLSRKDMRRVLPELDVKGSRVLIIEDEPLIGMMMKETLAKTGFDVVGPFNTVADAMEIVDTNAFDVAILDINLDGQSVYAIAEVLLKRQVPFIFITGYSAEGIDARFAHIPVLSKPVDPELLRRVFKIRENGAVAQRVSDEQLATTLGA